MTEKKQTLQERIFRKMEKGELPVKPDKAEKNQPGKNKTEKSKTDKYKSGSSPKYSEKSGSRKKSAGKEDFSKAASEKSGSPKVKGACPVTRACGGCYYQGIPYEEQLGEKQKNVKNLLGEFGKVEPIIGMDNPKYYRNKVHHVISRDYRNNIIAGFYKEKSHDVVQVSECMLEDKKSQEIITTLVKLFKSFKIYIYNEDNGTGLVRHVLIRRGFTTGEIMVVIVSASPIFPSKNNFVKALRTEHPEINTVVLNINDKDTSMVLGERNITLYGPGYIKDKLCGLTFRISPSSFYQINPIQTEKLYRTAIDYAALTGSETVIDAYCGIGTIGMAAADKAAKVIGVELNYNAVRDAKLNASENNIKNAEFYSGDAGDFMVELAGEIDAMKKGEAQPGKSGKTSAESAAKDYVVFMDPPRNGSTEKFIDAVAVLSPSRVVYVSCNPETQARDLKYFAKKGYKVRKIQPVDMFPYTVHVETVVLMSKV